MKARVQAIDANEVNDVNLAKPMKFETLGTKRYIRIRNKKRFVPNVTSE